jgi:hypothetical protein
MYIGDVNHFLRDLTVNLVFMVQFSFVQVAGMGHMSGSSTVSMVNATAQQLHSFYIRKRSVKGGVERRWQGCVEVLEGFKICVKPTSDREGPATREWKQLHDARPSMQWVVWYVSPKTNRQQAWRIHFFHARKVQTLHLNTAQGGNRITLSQVG